MPSDAAVKAAVTRLEAVAGLLEVTAKGNTISADIRLLIEKVTVRDVKVTKCATV
jgi:hypothetical protein